MKNSFEFFDLIPSLFIDDKQLRMKYLEIQRNAHPDLSSNDANDSELANIHYEILKDDIRRFKCLLELHADNKINQNLLEPAFLMDMMELNDEIEMAIAGNDNARESANNQLTHIHNALNATLNQLKEQWKSGEYLLVKMTENHWKLHVLWYQKYKYWLRLRKNLDGIEEM